MNRFTLPAGSAPWCSPGHLWASLQHGHAAGCCSAPFHKDTRGLPCRAAFCTSCTHPAGAGAWGVASLGTPASPLSCTFCRWKCHTIRELDKQTFLFFFFFNESCNADVLVQHLNIIILTFILYFKIVSTSNEGLKSYRKH